MVRRTIYETRQLEQSHSPIFRYKQLPQGPALWPCYMKPSPWFDPISTPTSTSTVPYYATIAVITFLLCQEPVHCRIRYPTQAPSLVSATSSWLAGSGWIRMNSPKLVQLSGSDCIKFSGSNFIWLAGYVLIRLPVSDLIRLTIFDWIWLRFFYLIWLIWLIFFDSIWLTFKAFIFDLGHIIRLPS